MDFQFGSEDLVFNVVFKNPGGVYTAKDKILPSYKTWQRFDDMKLFPKN